MKKHTKKLPREKYLAHAVRGFYLDFQRLRHNDPFSMKALKLGKFIEGWQCNCCTSG